LIFKKAITAPECSFPFFSKCHPQEVIAVVHIELREVSCTCDSVQHLIDQGERITTLGSEVVEATVIDTEA
jgi:hypothetical protein